MNEVLDKFLFGWAKKFLTLLEVLISAYRESGRISKAFAKESFLLKDIPSNKFSAKGTIFSYCSKVILFENGYIITEIIKVSKSASSCGWIIKIASRSNLNSSGKTLYGKLEWVSTNRNIPHRNPTVGVKYVCVKYN